MQQQLKMKAAVWDEDDKHCISVALAFLLTVSDTHKLLFHNDATLSSTGGKTVS